MFAGPIDWAKVAEQNQGMKQQRTAADTTVAEAARRNAQIQGMIAPSTIAGNLAQAGLYGAQTREVAPNAAADRESSLAQAAVNRASSDPMSILGAYLGGQMEGVDVGTLANVVGSSEFMQRLSDLTRPTSMSAGGMAGGQGRLGPNSKSAPGIVGDPANISSLTQGAVAPAKPFSAQSFFNSQLDQRQELPPFYMR